MKRFFLREFALLSLPVALVAGAGWWASRRPVLQPKPTYVGPTLQFRAETPTALRAFDGVQEVLTTSIAKDSQGAQFSAFGAPKLGVVIKTPQGTKIWDSQGTGNFNSAGFSTFIDNNQSFSVLMKPMSPGALTASFRGRTVNTALAPATKTVFLKGEWKVDTAKFKPFDFAIARAPLVTLTKATLCAASPTQLTAKVIFTLQGVTMNEKTTLDNQFHEAHGLSNGYSTNGNVAAPKTRVVECNLYQPALKVAGSAPIFIQLSGRVSADNRWPLAFAIEPFDFGKAKIGQKLKFKQWPAPLPSNARS